MFHMISGFISLRTWEHHVNILHYFRHYFPQVLVSRRRIKLRETHSNSFFLYWTLNEAIILWSKGCTTLPTLGGMKALLILLNCKVEKPNYPPLPTCLREWVVEMSIIKSTFRFWDWICTLRLIIQLFLTLMSCWLGKIKSSNVNIHIIHLPVPYPMRKRLVLTKLWAS